MRGRFTSGVATPLASCSKLEAETQGGLTEQQSLQNTSAFAMYMCSDQLAPLHNDHGTHFNIFCLVFNLSCCTDCTTVQGNMINEIQPWLHCMCIAVHALC